MIPIVFKYLTSKRFRGIALFPFIIAKKKDDFLDPVFINHEKIHLRQQLELFVVFFYLWYLIEFLWRWGQYKNTQKAYFSISFEREAYRFERDLDYCKSRPFWNFIKFCCT